MLLIKNQAIIAINEESVKIFLMCIEFLYAISLKT